MINNTNESSTTEATANAPGCHTAFCSLYIAQHVGFTQSTLAGHGRKPIL